jgi:recombination protein RecR
MNTIDKLSEQFSKFPGIGPRQAKRLVYFLLKKEPFFLKELSENILNLKQDVNICKNCYCFFQSKNPNKNGLCDICNNSTRDETVLMVVEKDADMENIEKKHIYNGKYFILGGTLPIMSKKANWIRSEELVTTIEKNKEELKEIILALSLTPEGENTIYHIIQTLKPITDRNSIKISTLGRGLSTGTELEYSDDETLKNALKNRS